MSIHKLDSGDYVAAGTLRLNQRVYTEVTFDSCLRNQCAGTFDFTDRDPIDFDLLWTQHNTVTGQGGDGGLHLSNSRQALGGIDTLYGDVVLEPTGKNGTLTLSGSGRDSLGGAYASIDFDLFGDVAPL